jgi:hypothetical protein
LPIARIEKQSINIKPRGGKRWKAGRKKGSPNKITVAMRAKVLENGTMPLEALLQIMNELIEAANLMHGETYHTVNAKVIDRLELLERAADIATKAAPYLHPKLQSVQHTGSDGDPIDKHITVEFVEAAGVE